jgi:hypothetical protein
MNQAEEVLYSHLTDVDSLDVLAAEGFSLGDTQKVIPTELGRALVSWALDYYFLNGRRVAPTKHAFLETWGDEMEKVDISINDEFETDSIEWAIDQLRTTYAVWRSQQFVKSFVTDVTTADPTAKVLAIQEGAHELYSLARSLMSHRRESVAGAGIEGALQRHKERAVAPNSITGMAFGLPEIDDHIHGVHDGEIAVFAAFSGVGKSWIAAKVALAEWKRERRSVLVTLENDLEMTFDRMACAYSHVDYDKWQRGQADAGDLQRVEAFRDQLMASEHAPIVVMPEDGDRTMMNLVRKAVTLGGDSLIIDQLSHVEANPGSSRMSTWEVIRDQMRDLKTLIGDGRERVPCLLLHQIKREGMVRARKTGSYVMDDLANSSEVERSADFVFSVLQSEDDVVVGQALWQTLKARRVPPKDWIMAWRLGVGDIRVRHEVTS